MKEKRPNINVQTVLVIDEESFGDKSSISCQIYQLAKSYKKVLYKEEADKTKYEFLVL